MSGTSSVPRVEFTDLGFVVPAAEDIVTGLNADYNAAFGGNLNTAPNTPQGQLIASTAAILLDRDDQEAALFNGVDPALASGRLQDAIARIYFLERLPAQSTVLEVTCTGLAGVVIPSNALISDTSGNLYFCTGQGVIGVGGTVILSFSAENSGPTPIPASNGISIYQAIPGWDSVSVSTGAVGNVVENRAQFEARRKATVAANARGTLESIQGAVLKVPGVIDAYTTENFTSAPVTIRGVSLNANSLYVCVAGGASADIAEAIFTKKNPGCNYTGNTTVTVFDDNAGYNPPFPSYAVTFQIPTGAPIVFNVDLVNSAQVPANALALIQQALVTAFIGADGGPRARIGSTLYASRFYGAIAALGSWAQIIDLKIGTSIIPDASFTAAIAGTTLTTSVVASGALAIGQFVFGTNILPGTIITAGSGVSWTVSLSQTIGSEAMVSAMANDDSIATQINWLPTLNAANIKITLV